LKWAAPAGNTFTTFTPTFTNITVGNGTVTGRQCTNGSLTTVFGSIKFGSTTSVGGGMSTILPTSFTTPWERAQKLISYRDDSTNSEYVGTTYPNGATGFYFGRMGTNGINGNTIDATIPFTWAVNDTITFLLQYEV